MSELIAKARPVYNQSSENPGCKGADKGTYAFSRLDRASQPQSLSTLSRKAMNDSSTKSCNWGYGACTPVNGTTSQRPAGTSSNKLIAGAHKAVGVNAEVDAIELGIETGSCT
jgi:hypothetical protein